MPARVLVCDDEELIRWSVAEHLRGEGFEVQTAEDGEDALEQALSGAPDAILLDLKMPKLDGLSALRKMREKGVEVPVIVLTAHGGVESAIEATQLGAADYLAKPFDLREVTLSLRKALDETRLAHEVSYLRGRSRAGYERLVGASPSMRRVFETLERLEQVEAPTVLITGESGTGKDLVAQAIHARGPRSGGPYMEIDCASLPEQLIESELFGHERGSFTDARQLKRGLFEVARGGTIFLDEIAEMSPGTQAKLLRALENRRFKRVGGVVDLPLDAGVIAATNRNLREEVRAGRFREDLYFRLAIIPIELPALRQRPTDVPLLVGHLLERLRGSMGRVVEGVAPDALRALQRYDWPGNVRELRNVIERCVILYGDAGLIRGEHLPPEIRFGPTADGPASAGFFELPEGGIDLEDVERSFLVQALERTGGNQTAASKLLGISRYALRYRMDKFGLKPPPRGL